MKTQKNKRICLVTPSLRMGGLERVISELAWYFAELDYIETHLIIQAKGEKFYPIHPRVIVHEPGFDFNKRYWFIYTLKTIAFIRKRLQKIKPDAVLSFGEMYNSLTLLSSLFLNIKVFVSDRSKPDRRWGVFQEYLRRKLYPFAYGIVSQTNYSKKYLEQIIKHKNIEIIPNPIKKISLPKLASENIILHVGRLISTKQVDVLIEIFSKVNNNQWKLWLVGDGHLKDSLIKKAKKLGVSNHVVFWGSRDDVDYFYSKAKIFAFTSNSEGFPNTIGEAMSAGIPCISFNCVAGPSDLINDNINGFLVEQGIIKEFVTKLNKLIASKSMRISFGNQARLKMELFTLEKIGSRYLNFLLK